MLRRSHVSGLWCDDAAHLARSSAGGAVSASDTAGAAPGGAFPTCRAAGRMRAAGPSLMHALRSACASDSRRAVATRLRLRRRHRHRGRGPRRPVSVLPMRCAPLAALALPVRLFARRPAPPTIHPSIRQCGVAVEPVAGARSAVRACRRSVRPVAAPGLARVPVRSAPFVLPSAAASAGIARQSRCSSHSSGPDTAGSPPPPPPWCSRAHSATRRTLSMTRSAAPSCAPSARPSSRRTSLCRR